MSKKYVEYTLATHAVEKLSPSKEALQLCEKLSDGQIGADVAVAKILERYGLKRGVSYD